MLTGKICRAERADKSSGLSARDRETLIAATAAAKQRMRIFDCDSWPVAERGDEPVHISVIIREWLTMRGLSSQHRSAGRG